MFSTLLETISISDLLFFAKSCCLTLSQTTNFFSSRFKALADDNFKFDENSQKLAKHVENTAGNGEITHYEQIPFFPHCFQKACTADT